MSIKAACSSKSTWYMYKSISILIILLYSFINTNAQSPKVPAVVEFAGMKLKISEQARKDIQSDVDALYRSEKYFNIKVERVDLYFPIIERVLKEEGVPEDFKYLVIQESSLISDAVSTSNAVGFWQFKQDAGEEVGLKINAYVDERMNIVSSTRGAATYLKKHNSYFDNWIYSLLGYYLGRGGAKSVADPKLFGADKMEIDKNTNWYILKFLAHKIAFENAIGKNSNPPLMLKEYASGADKTLKEISLETQVEIEILEHYNKWLKKGRVPSDKLYTVILPIEGIKEKDLLASNDEDSLEEMALLPGEKNVSSSLDKYPKIVGDVTNRNEPLLVSINGRPGIIARGEDGIASMATYGGIKEERFKRINDITPGHKVKEGQFYYFKPKKNNAPIYYHTVQIGESVWEIAQMYGIKQRNLLRKNRMSSTGAIKPGMVLWLRYIRPANEAIAYRPVENPEKKKQIQEEPSQQKEKFEEQQLSQNNSGTIEKENQEIKNKLPENQEKQKEEVINTQVEKEPIEPDIEVQNVTPEDVKNETAVEKPIPTDDSIQHKKVPQEEIVINNKKDDDDPYGNNEVTFIESKKSEAKKEKNDIHVVQQGETLYGISRQYRIPIQDLASWNNLKYNEAINIGQSILVNSPVKITSEETEDVRKEPEKVLEKFIQHKVVAGETLYKIAREHNVTIKEVMEWNGKTDFNVALGEVIKIKKIIGND